MYQLGVRAAVPCCCWSAASGAAWWAQRFLREQHRSRESVDSIRVVITLLVTFAALVLGLVISSAQTRLGTLQGGLRGLSTDITELDQRLREYGPTVDPLRADLILYTKAAIADHLAGGTGATRQLSASPDPAGQRQRREHRAWFGAEPDRYWQSAT